MPAAARRLVAGGHVGARAAAVRDSRALVRTLFLASAAECGLLPFLVGGGGRPVDEIAARLGALRRDRLESWLRVGVAVGALRHRGGRYRARGVRARALAAADPVLVAHYRSVVEYQAPVYQELAGLLAGTGHRRDMSLHAGTIAGVSLAAAPFVEPLVAKAAAAPGVRRILDAGCGTGHYLCVALAAAEGASGVGVDIEAAAVDEARRRVVRAGLTARLEVHAGDLRRVAADHPSTFDLVLLLNSVYYVAPGERAALFAALRAALRPRGQLLVVTMVRPGSVASAQLDLLLRVQAGEASLPTRGELLADLAAAGFAEVAAERIVPTEPFLAVRARRV